MTDDGSNLSISVDISTLTFCSICSAGVLTLPKPAIMTPNCQIFLAIYVASYLQSTFFQCVYDCQLSEVIH